MSTIAARGQDAIEQDKRPFAVILGTAQDGGYPQVNCQKGCCKPAWEDQARRRFVSCIAVVDPQSKQRWLFDCTPDFRDQIRLLDQSTPKLAGRPLDGVFPTHAHVGHYTGLMFLGREVLGARSVPVFAMPRMKYFLESNGPWNQLVKLEQIRIERISAAQTINLNTRIQVIPFLVPHRDEYSETVGFEIRGPNLRVAYLPDIDKWEKWSVPIEKLIAKVDVALLDGTFFSGDELPGRNMSEIPHPSIQESMKRFSKLPQAERTKIRFIHLNHSNPLLRPESGKKTELQNAGMDVAEQFPIPASIIRL
ncbi:MAG: MBL fold metallo-hydrolase [Pirellulaceae bacterium]